MVLTASHCNCKIVLVVTVLLRSVTVLVVFVLIFLNSSVLPLKVYQFKLLLEGAADFK